MSSAIAQHSPTPIENFIFTHRMWIVLLSVLITVFLSYNALQLKPDTRLEKLIPGGHEFVQTANEFLEDDEGGGVSYIRVAVQNKKGEIFDYEYLTVLQRISDELSLLDGVNTTSLNSLWAPSMLWFAITPEGYQSGPVIDNGTFADTKEELEKVRSNILRASLVGSYVSSDFSSSMIDFEVLPVDPRTRQQLDAEEFGQRLETVRDKYESDSIGVYIIGDVKKIGDLVSGFAKIVLFFSAAFIITAALLYNYSRCIRSTLVPLLCSLIAVVWQLGLLYLLEIDVGVFSVLVPFLVFAIAVSHGVQVINSIAHESAEGRGKLAAVRYTFHQLHRPGLIALLSDGIGFAMLFVIAIGAIQDLAMVASIGVAVVIITNLVLLPVLMSYVGVSSNCVEHAQYKLEERSALWEKLSAFAESPWARTALIAAVLLLLLGVVTGLNLKIGDLGKGAPELRVESRYNQDNRFITENFSTSTDQMTIFVGTPQKQCDTYKTIDLIDRLGWELSQAEGVQNVSSPANNSKMNRYFTNEGNLKFLSLPRDEIVLARSLDMSGLGVTSDYDEVCDQQRLEVELTDHRQETLQHIVKLVQEFAGQNNDDQIQFRLGYGNAAFEAATNQVIERAQYEILAYVYGVVGLMVLLMFRSIKAVICILLPLALTSILCQGVMAQLGIGVKVATLPVIALGVGIGVDYGIYIFSQLKNFLEKGHPLRLAYLETLKTTGKAVSFTGMTLAVGVATWIFSPIKFQADMGILLTFMFLWNMVGALTLLPALAYFLSVNKTTVEP